MAWGGRPTSFFVDDAATEDGAGPVRDSPAALDRSFLLGDTAAAEHGTAVVLEHSAAPGDRAAVVLGDTAAAGDGAGVDLGGAAAAFHGA